MRRAPVEPMTPDAGGEGAAPPAPAPRSPYLVGREYDWAFFLLPPSLSLFAGVAVSGSRFSDEAFRLADLETTWAALLMSVLIQAHLVAVFFRSHGNPAIFRLHRVRFVVVPLLLWVGFVSSPWVAVTGSVVATFWDVWHSGAQTFGFVRIYERNAGVPAEDGRRLDFWLNQVLYAGPILAGATLMDHVRCFEEYSELGGPASLWLSAVPVRVEGMRGELARVVIGAGTLFLAYYVWHHVRRARAGVPTSPLKVFLLTSTGLCSLYTWGLDSWGEAFLIMNLFHAVQYLALVWATEGPRLRVRLRLGDGRRGRAVAATCFLGAVAAYGTAATLVHPSVEALWAVTLVVSLMHFWYDAFIWSVRRAQV